MNDSELPALTFRTNSRISSFEITLDEISDIIDGLDINKVHGPDNVSVNMIKLCGRYLRVPLKIIFDNIIKGADPLFFFLRIMKVHQIV